MCSRPSRPAGAASSSCSPRSSAAAGYGEVVTPLLEDYGVFARVGDATDLVQKEMYRFTDTGGRDVALRPEFTAAVCRAFAEHRPATPWKVWSGGPLLRYERPQRGRYRQFEQVNLEVLGSDDPMVDVEVIALGWRFFERLGLRQVTLLVNSLGHPRRNGRSTSRRCAATSPTTSMRSPTRPWRRSPAIRCASSTPSAPRTPR